jgi:hypothetical protein
MPTCAGLNVRHNQSRHRITKPTTALPWGPSLTARVTSLDLELMPHIHEGVSEVNRTRGLALAGQHRGVDIPLVHCQTDSLDSSSRRWVRHLCEGVAEGDARE